MKNGGYELMLHYATLRCWSRCHYPLLRFPWRSQDMVNSGHGQCDVCCLMIKLSQPGCYHNVLLLVMYHGSGDNNLSSITWPAGSHCAWSVCVFRLVWCSPDSKQQSSRRHWLRNTVVLLGKPLFKSKFLNCPTDFILASCFIKFYTE